MSQAKQEEETLLFNKTGKMGKYFDFSAVPGLGTIAVENKSVTYLLLVSERIRLNQSFVKESYIE